MIVAVIYATFAVARKNTEKKFRLLWDLNVVVVVKKRKGGGVLFLTT